MLDYFKTIKHETTCLAKFVSRGNYYFSKCNFREWTGKVDRKYSDSIYYEYDGHFFRTDDEYERFVFGSSIQFVENETYNVEEITAETLETDLIKALEIGFVDYILDDGFAFLIKRDKGMDALVDRFIDGDGRYSVHGGDSILSMRHVKALDADKSKRNILHNAVKEELLYWIKDEPHIIGNLIQFGMFSDSSSIEGEIFKRIKTILDEVCFTKYNKTLIPYEQTIIKKSRNKLR